jgi:Family of unknown function (DUF5941)
VTPLELGRDDGPLARAIGGALGTAVRLPPIVLLVLGSVPLLVAAAAGGDDASDATAGVVLASLVLTAGTSAGRPLTDPMRWAVPPMLRLLEYASILWLGTLAGGSGPAAAFALISVLAFHHYDLFYRPRFQGLPAPRWVGDVAGGWEGRLIAAYVLLLLHALPAGLFAGAGLLAVLFAGDSIAGWSRRSGSIAAYADPGDGDE